MMNSAHATGAKTELATRIAAKIAKTAIVPTTTWSHRPSTALSVKVAGTHPYDARSKSIPDLPTDDRTIVITE